MWWAQGQSLESGLLWKRPEDDNKHRMEFQTLQQQAREEWESSGKFRSFLFLFSFPFLSCLFCFPFLFFNLREDTQAGSPRHPNGGARNKIRQKSQIFALFFIFNLLHPVKHSIVSKATLGGPSVHCLMSGRPS